MSDINLRYRNAFTNAQKLVWFNEEQRELFDCLELNSPPYAFTTVDGINIYPFPDEFDTSKINVVSMQINTSSPSPTFVEVPSKYNDDNVFAPRGVWYTVVSNTMFLYYPNTMPGNMVVYVYCDASPTDVTEATMDLEPDLPTKYQEILKIGVLKRIAGARKDIVMRNNFDAEYQEKIADVLWARKLEEPEWAQPTSTQKFRSHNNGYIINGW
ncbi:hypothetical protein NKT34_13580 [Paenibacillus polysaccharolyticus]|uniref:phage adaptor protein n=1 Tax=Paenibacillus polysaccharolyticus TaxID=582692 RepID=UPI00209E098A|nr:hypothetical protein [Paenibacillus polysaccharolyticus]MCP1134330.1 hypothetical protein [Paenibacillus polysaccharolyticus]